MMRVLRLQSGLDQENLLKALDRIDAVAVRTDAVESLEEIELAHHLAETSFRKKTNIARKMRYEFLLWLAGKTDIRSAMEATSINETREFLLLVFSDKKKQDILRLLEANERPLALKKNGEPLKLERISLSRVKN